MFVEYSLWWLIPILFIAILGSWILYFFKKKSNFSKIQTIILSFLRFFSLFLALLLLLSPNIKNKKNIVEKPVVVVAQDNSSSILKSKYSTFYKNEYKKRLNKLIESLKDDYDVKLMSFGSEAMEINNEEINKLSYQDYATDISDVFLKIEDKYSNLNLSSIILASDGIINKGSNTFKEIENLEVPVFTVAMGDTTIKKDLSISEVRFNRISYLNNKFPLEIVALAKKAKGSHSLVKVTKDGKTLFEEGFNVDNESYSKSFATTLLADRVGISHYTISLKTIENEQTIVNNTRDIFVEVLDSRQKILLIGNSPHPDLSAIKQSIEKNENYEVKSFLFNDFPSSLKEYNIAILHQIPSLNPQHLKVIQKLKEANIPILFIIGSQTNISYFNSLSIGLTIIGSKTTLNSTTGSFNSNFTLFSISKETENILSKLPPLQSPFGKYQISPLTQSLVLQNVGASSTDYPLIAFINNVSERYGIIVGEGFWRWRLQNFLINQTHEQTDEIIHKSIQYLATKIDRSRFRVICDEVCAENQPVIFDAELYNDSYELVNEPEVKLIIANNENKRYPFVFSRTSNAYHLNLGAFPEGKYKYIASTNYGNKAYKAEGEFHISSQNLEEIDLVANHNLLFNISERTTGKMIYPNEVEKLKEMLSKRKDIKPIVHQSIINRKLIDQWWYLSLIIALFVAEWFLRKYWGKG